MPASPKPRLRYPVRAKRFPGKIYHLSEVFKVGSKSFIISLLKSKIVAVTLKAKEGETTYHLHSSLLCRESKRFLKDLTWLGGLHKEASNLTIDLVDESEFHFMSFVAYLYGRFVPPVNDAIHMIRLAELYAMAERFMADGFAKTLEDAFISKYTVVQYTSQQVYDLLHIAYDFITQRNPEDPIRDCIFHLAASKLTTLRLFDPFRNLLYYDPELAVEICLRVGGTPDKRKLDNTPVNMRK